MMAQNLLNAAFAVYSFLAIPFILFLPGYFLCQLLFPTWQNRSWEKFILSVGLSLGISMAAGFILYSLQIPLHPRYWFLIQVVITIIFMLISKRKIQKEEVPAKGKSRNLAAFLLYFYAFILVVFSLSISILNSRSSSTTSFSQLWITPADQQESYTIGVMNQEAAARDYRLELWQDDQLIETWSDIHLARGQKWETIIEPGSFQPGTAESEYEARLYDQENPAEVYRTVHLKNGN